MHINKQLFKAQLHTKLAVHQRLKTKTYQALATVNATVAETYRLKAQIQQSKLRQQGILPLNAELQAQQCWQKVEQHQTKSEWYYLAAYDSKERAVAHERLADYLQGHQGIKLKVEDCENAKQSCDRRG